MALSPGTRLGPYEVTALIGEGGMGKVWRAHHTALNRDDALKVLPDAFASDPDRLARFRREAQVLASLNHPNIAHVYGLEQADGVQALVMELVEGPTLADRIAQGPIPVDEALSIARQIAEALEAAHEQGIIHRDLKPANIKIKPDGSVKVLDFGLAKLAEPSAAGTNPSPLSLSPTITSPALMTGVGVLLGTAAYMSPEQAKGREADKRSDIWAFGAVLYEMLSGKRAFAGDDVPDTLIAVFRDDPDWSALPTDTPARIRQVMRVCLQRNPKQRAQAIGDVRLALAGAFDVPVPATVTEPSRFTPLRQAWPWLAAAVVLSAGVTGIVIRTVTAVPPPQPVRRLEHMLPQSLELAPGNGKLVALSPDGHTLVYRARQNGVWRVYRRALDELQAQPIVGTESLNPNPFLSADGRWLGFIIGTDLMKVSLAGGRPVRVGELPAPPRGGSWGADNNIVVATLVGLLRIPATGGKPQVLVAPQTGRQYADPQVLPGGRAVLVTSTQPAPNSGDVLALDLATGMTQMVIRDGVAGRYVPTGHLVFLRGGDLWAVPFDPQRLTISGDPVVVEQGIRVEAGGAVQFALADEGTLAYIPAGNNEVPRKLVWVDRAGKEEPLPGPERTYQHPRISPDGTRVAVDALDQERDIWIWNGQTLTRLTFGPETQISPVWWPDGRSLIFASGEATLTDIFRQAADGTGSMERLTEGAKGWVPTSVVPDGSEILLREVAQGSGTAIDLAQLRVSPASPAKLNTPTPLVRTPFSERNAEVSPGSQWLAYESDESGRLEIYVRPFPDVNGGRWEVSTGGGRMPLWSRDGRELFYVSPEGAMMVSRVEAGRTWVATTPVQLFRSDYMFATPANTRTFDIAPDGKRFLMIKEIATPNPRQASIVVVEHFDQELKRLAPSK